jgi:hypothetical protein
MMEVDLGRAVDPRRFVGLLPWQAEFLNTALVSEFSNRQALSKSRHRGSSEDSASSGELWAIVNDGYGARHSLSPSLARPRCHGRYCGHHELRIPTGFQAVPATQSSADSRSCSLSGLNKHSTAPRAMRSVRRSRSEWAVMKIIGIVNLRRFNSHCSCGPDIPGIETSNIRH